MNWIRKILKGISLTAAMFVFQACYGTMNDYYDTSVTFHVVDNETGEPIPNIDIFVQESFLDSAGNHIAPRKAEITDSDGMATIWTTEDIESYIFKDKNALYITVDTIVRPNTDDTIDIVLKKA